jgi:hypothetical protein
MNMKMICGREHVMVEGKIISIIFLGVKMNTAVTHQLVNRRVYRPSEESILSS